MFIQQLRTNGGAPWLHALSEIRWEQTMALRCSGKSKAHQVAPPTFLVALCQRPGQIRSPSTGNFGILVEIHEIAGNHSRNEPIRRCLPDSSGNQRAQRTCFAEQLVLLFFSPGAIEHNSVNLGQRWNRNRAYCVFSRADASCSNCCSSRSNRAATVGFAAFQATAFPYHSAAADGSESCRKAIAMK